MTTTITNTFTLWLHLWLCSINHKDSWLSDRYLILSHQGHTFPEVELVTKLGIFNLESLNLTDYSLFFEWEFEFSLILQTAAILILFATSNIVSRMKRSAPSAEDPNGGAGRPPKRPEVANPGVGAPGVPTGAPSVAPPLGGPGVGAPGVPTVPPTGAPPVGDPGVGGPGVGAPPTIPPPEVAAPVEPSPPPLVRHSYINGEDRWDCFYEAEQGWYD